MILRVKKLHLTSGGKRLLIGLVLEFMIGL